MVTPAADRIKENRNGTLGNCGVPDLGAAWDEHLKARGHHRLAEAGGRRGQGAERDQVTERHEAIQRRMAHRSRRSQDRGPPVPGQSDGQDTFKPEPPSAAGPKRPPPTGSPCGHAAPAD